MIIYKSGLHKLKLLLQREWRFVSLSLSEFFQSFCVFVRAARDV